MAAQEQVARPQDSSPPRSALALYASFGVLQALDMHSTHRALAHGGREANPIVNSVGTPMLMVGLKAGATTGIIFLSEKLRKRNRVAAMLVMVALNSTYAVVVSNNYAIGR
jgi:ABC-type uncharacterized transport system permease subunit